MLSIKKSEGKGLQYWREDFLMVVDGSEGVWEVGKVEPRSRKGLSNGREEYGWGYTVSLVLGIKQTHGLTGLIIGYLRWVITDQTII
jgi:hypothetical protein